MTRRVVHLPSRAAVLEVQVDDEHPLLPDDRAGEDVTRGSHDRGVPCRQHVIDTAVQLVAPGHMGAVVAATHALVDPDHEHPPLPGDVSKGRHPAV